MDLVSRSCVFANVIVHKFISHLWNSDFYNYALFTQLFSSIVSFDGYILHSTYTLCRMYMYLFFGFGGSCSITLKAKVVASLKMTSLLSASI